MFDVPLNFLGGFGIQNKSNREFITLPHRIRNNISLLEFINESFSTGIKQETTNTSQSFGSKEFDFSVGILRIYETRGMDLYFIHVDSLSSDRHDLKLVYNSDEWSTIF